MTRGRAALAQRPKGLLATLVIGATVGAMGLGSNVLVLLRLTLATPRAFETALPGGATGQGPLVLIAELGRGLEVTMAPWRATLIATAALHLLAAALLLFGALRALRLREDGRRIFLASLVPGVATGLLRMSLALKMSATLQRSLSESLFHAGARMGAEAADLAPLAERAGEGITLAFIGLSAASLLLELAYYVAAARYLTRPKIRAIYLPPST